MRRRTARGYIETHGSCVFYPAVANVQRAVLLTDTRPSDDRATELAWNVVRDFAGHDVTAVAWEFVDELPAWLDLDLQFQLSQHRWATPEGQYIVVYLGSEEEIDALHAE